MTAALHHRGPDSGDVWTDKEAGIALGHRRLAIIDLSEAGHQPMVSSCGRYIITYNGEIYNADELREELRACGRVFRGHSDTEVILEGCAVWGIEKTIDRLIGMFAFGIWDTQIRELALVRDRLGIKPLYWSFQNGLFLFASELKAFRQIPNFETTIDYEAVAAFLKHNCIGGTHTIYAAANKLAPGHILKIRNGRDPKIQPFWRLEDCVRKGEQNPFSGSDEEAINALETILQDAVTRRMVSDVPLGAFLSGGVDSSTVVALMQKSSPIKVRTFTIGFDESDYNEADDAAAVAQHLGTDHTELYVSPQQARDVIPKLPLIYDEPFADSSQIPTYLVSALTRNHVTVSLSGDGGDELFAGYNRYVQAKTLMRIFWSLPGFVRRSFAHLIHSVPVQHWNSVIQRLGLSSKVRMPGEKIQKFADVLLETKEGFYPRLVTHWPSGYEVAKNAIADEYALWSSSLDVSKDFMDRMQFVDTITYLPDDILAKVDRASMAVSLEARVPLIDHRVVEFAWTLPRHLKLRYGRSKWILRQLLYRHVPKKLIDRPKTGFGIPIDQWLRGPLREWAEDLLNENMVNKYALLNSAPVRAKWQEHLKGDRNWQYPLWDILMLQAWCEEWM